MDKNKIISAASASLDLPPDLISGAVRVTLLGQETIEVINHKGIVIYQKDQITINLAKGRLNLFGSNLVLVQLNEEQITVEGYIESLNFLEDEDEG